MKDSLALVVGNADYTLPQHKLINTINDASDIADKLERLGYTVIRSFNNTTADLCKTISDFGQQLQGYKTGLFYYSGHGLQIKSRNFLTGIDTQFTDETAAEYTSLQLAMIIDYMEKAGLETQIIILDACRNNPFTGQYRNVYLPGLAPVYAPKGFLIAFSTSPGEKALDYGAGQNSIYTGSLLNHLDDPHIQIEEMFKRVRTTVYNLSAGKQTSWEHTSMIGDYYFNRGQMIQSKNLPYTADVIEDKNWQSTGTSFDDIIIDLKSHNWDTQNSGINKLDHIKIKDIDPNTQFLLGRNILQAANGGAFAALSILQEKLIHWLNKFNAEGANHFLNGMLYEMYFDSNGKFRGTSPKSNLVNELYAFQTHITFKSSFKFIREQLLAVPQCFVYVPNDPPIPMSLEVIFEKNPLPENDDSYIFNTYYSHVLKSIKSGNMEVLKSSSMAYSYDVISFEDLKKQISHALAAPLDMLRLNCNISDTVGLAIYTPSPLFRCLNPYYAEEDQVTEPFSW